MEYTKVELKQRLAGSLILIVEDDLDIARGVAEVLNFYGVEKTDIVVKRCVEGDTHGGLNTLRNQGWTFDFILVDIMLPLDERSLKECDELQGQWDAIQEQIAPLRGRKGANTELKRLRERLNIVSRQLGEIIDRQAGIEMIKTWLAETPTSGVDTHGLCPAILFLTARQEESLRSIFRDFEIPWRWLTKPALESQVLTAVSELLDERTVEPGA